MPGKLEDGYNYFPKLADSESNTPQCNIPGYQTFLTNKEEQCRIAPAIIQPFLHKAVLKSDIVKINVLSHIMLFTVYLQRTYWKPCSI